jgi:hypothetical protein
MTSDAVVNTGAGSSRDVVFCRVRCDVLEVCLPDWRDEVCSALDFWISAEGGARQAERLTCLGAARQESQQGWYSIDSRSSINVDQVESLGLSGKAGPGAGPAYTVLDATQDGPVLRVRVAEFIDLADAYLWQNKQPATYLLTKLREGIANLADPGLAHDLAAGRLATAPKITRQVHGFTEMQKEACESCLSAGVRLVELDCDPAALRLIEQIRRGLGGTKREALKHLGEAEVIYFLEVHAPDWTFVSDDRTAVDSPGIGN